MDADCVRVSLARLLFDGTLTSATCVKPEITQKCMCRRVSSESDLFR